MVSTNLILRLMNTKHKVWLSDERLQITFSSLFWWVQSMLCISVMVICVHELKLHLFCRFITDECTYYRNQQWNAFTELADINVKWFLSLFCSWIYKYSIYRSFPTIPFGSFSILDIFCGTRRVILAVLWPAQDEVNWHFWASLWSSNCVCGGYERQCEMENVRTVTPDFVWWHWTTGNSNLQKNWS